jgi:hypothetical protein
VRTLHGLGLIELTGETRVRGAVAHHYQAVTDPERAADASMAPGAKVSALDPEICPVVAGGNFEDEDALAKLASLRLDTAGWRELSQACTRLFRQADLIARSSAERLARNPEEADREAGMALFMFEARQSSGEAVS